MNTSALDVVLDALYRDDRSNRRRVDRNELEERLVAALRAHELPADLKLLLQDTLLLFHQLQLLSQKKGVERQKAWAVYQRLDLVNGKHLLRNARDAMACDLIASEMHRLGKKRLTADIKDPVAHLLGMPNNPPGVAAIWRKGGMNAKMRVTKKLPSRQVEDLKQAIREITATIARESK